MTRAGELQRMVLIRLFACAAVVLVAGVAIGAQREGQGARQPTVDSDAAVHLPAVTVPFSSLASPEAKRNFLDFAHGFTLINAWVAESDDIGLLRRRLDDNLMRPGVEKLRATFPVKIKPAVIGGVQTDVIDPVAGPASRNKKRVLINLHGGGFEVGARLGGQMESIPIASLGSIRVITVDYREGPESHFPAASEDVAAVYRALLKTYPPHNIGLFGCSAGGVLVAESLAWFQAHGLPRPGAVGMFGAGALIDAGGDSHYVGPLLMGWPISSEGDKNPYFDVPQGTLKSPLVSPAHFPAVLQGFPPSLLISGTRDSALSSVAYTQAQLVKAGVQAELHVWEGVPHCGFAQPVVDPRVPETREAWNVIVRFFDQHLGI